MMLVITFEQFFLFHLVRSRKGKVELKVVVFDSAGKDKFICKLLRTRSSVDIQLVD